MPKDFAGRGRTQSTPRSKRKPRKRNTKQSVLFHGPSFSVGALVGAAIVVLAAYGPELFFSDQPAPVVDATPPQQTPNVIFDFPKLLENTEVKPDPKPYAVPPKPVDDLAATYTIQAASFKRRDDADKLRAKLLLDGLPAKTSSRQVDGQMWFRVTVGPFIKRVEADRAMTRLRGQSLSAIWINNHN